MSISGYLRDVLYRLRYGEDRHRVCVDDQGVDLLKNERAVARLRWSEVTRLTARIEDRFSHHLEILSLETEAVTLDVSEDAEGYAELRQFIEGRFGMPVRGEHSMLVAGSS
jgi:hypothetical protein